MSELLTTTERPAVVPSADGPTPTDLAAAGYTDVGVASDVPMLEGRRATVDGQRVAIFRLPSGFAATNASCPHKEGPLSDGLVADGCVTCPLHNWRVDLTTGAVAGRDERLPIHEVVEDRGRLWVRLTTLEGPIARDV